MNFDSEKAERTIIKLLDESGPIGMGFLTECGFISAAHCLPKMPEPDNLSDAVKVKIKNLSGLESYALVSGAEPCLDLTILSDCSGSGIGVDLAPVELNEYHQLLQSTEKTQINLEEPELEKEIIVYIYNHKGQWLEGRTVFLNPFSLGLVINLSNQNERIERGTSGAPVFDSEGQVLGVVNVASENSPEGMMAYLANCLPGWALKELKLLQT